MKMQIILYVVLTLLFGSCTKNDPEKEGPCGVKDPIEELAWLKKDTEKLINTQPVLTSAYFSYIYKGERVFWLWSIFSAGNLEYRACDGERKYIPSPLPEDQETQDFIKLLNTPRLACPYLIWSSPKFDELVKCK
jgi:hypothetical protein